MKILCYGDSNTYGYDPRSFFGDRYPTEERWVDVLAGQLGCEAVNAGENGRQIPHREAELAFFRRMLAREMPVDLLTVMLGTNDLLAGNPVEEVIRRMERFLACTGLPGEQILIIGPPPMEFGEWVTDPALIDASRELNRAYEALSHRLGIRYADPVEWDLSVAFDGVHLSPEGHRALAMGLYSMLAKEGK